MGLYTKAIGSKKVSDTVKGFNFGQMEGDMKAYGSTMWQASEEDSFILIQAST
jgi:hypothetical protein